MNCKPIKTRRVSPSELTLEELIDESVTSFQNNSILAITSKVVSLCEGNIVSIKETDKESLIEAESDYYLSAEHSKYGHHFTITNNTLIAGAGIDESNGDNVYILWPKDTQQTANTIRRYIMDKYNLTCFGVIITDSTCQPLRLGTTGIVLAHSGFHALRNYIGTPDLFGRPFGVTQANIAGGLAAAAVLVMGEGAERLPLCEITDLDFIDFQKDDPTDNELSLMSIPPEDDLFEPFLSNADWQKGRDHDSK
ncbi:MAG: coenzyme F420-0:L-glutamate ligase [Candidatus Saccharimonadales bacterium]